MYELDRYIMLIRRTGFNPFRLAAAYASCSPPSPASGDGSYDDRAPARHFVLSFCAHTQRITEFAAKPRDFRMERHVLGSGRSVSGRRRGSPRRLRNVTLRRKAALFASEMTKNISSKFHFEICLEIFRNREPRFSRLTEAHAKRAIAVRKVKAMRLPHYVTCSLPTRGAKSWRDRTLFPCRGRGWRSRLPCRRGRGGRRDER